MSGTQDSHVQAPDLLLVTVLGKNPSEARYQLGEQDPVTATLAPLALIRLLPQDLRPQRVLALCTDDAERETWPILADGLRQDGIVGEPLRIKSDYTDVASFLELLAKAIPRQRNPSAFLVDATHGFRHFTLLTTLAVQYLSALRSTPLAGAYYALFNRDEPSPFINLRALLELPNFIYAIRAFTEAGNAEPLARQLRVGDKLEAKAAGELLRMISEAQDSGLPLELGNLSARFRADQKKPVRRVLRNAGALLDYELWLLLDESLERFAFRNPARERGWKSKLPLSEAELRRQALLIDDLRERDIVASMLSLMNEWTVSLAALRRGVTENWLDFNKVRRGAAHRLDVLRVLNEEPDLTLSERERRFAEYWDYLRELRNAYAHNGMRPQELIGGVDNGQTRNKLATVLQYWDQIKTTLELPLGRSESRERKLLVCPVKKSPGVLYSAVHACRARGLSPDSILVVVSDQTPDVSEALRRANFEGDVNRLIMSDPSGGVGELQRLVELSKGYVLRAQQVLVNLTGGTTLMGLAVDAIGSEARRFACDTYRFGLVDRRNREEQERAPYRESEAFWLTDGANDD